MLKHIVMMKLKEFSSEEKEVALDKLLGMLKALETCIEEIKWWEVGRNTSTKASAYDIVLLSGFESEESLDIYRKHPEHIKVLDFMKEVVDKVSVVDYTVSQAVIIS